MWLSIMLADYRQRSRSRGFWLTLLLTSAITFLLFPAENALYSVVNINGYRGVYNSAFIGDTLSLLNSLVFPIFGFYLIKNALLQDQRNKVDSLLAASAMNRFSYLGGKVISNFLLLSTLIVTMSLTAILIQYYRGESYQLDWYTLFKPQLIIVVPMTLIIAFLGVLFESIKLLRGGVGNLLFFFLWMPLLILQMESGLGANLIISQLESAVSLLPVISDNVAIGGMPIDEPLKTFLWHGTSFDEKAFYFWLYCLLFCLVVFLVSTIFYQRYDSSPTRFNKRAKLITPDKFSQSIIPENHVSQLSPLTANKTQQAFFRLLIGEFRLLVRGRVWWWYTGALIQIVLAIVLPIETVRLILLPLFGIWSILIVSSLGCRDHQFNTLSIISYNVTTETQRLFCMWLAATVLQLILASGLLIKLTLETQSFSALQLIIGCCFIPALAITLGKLTQTTRTFEIVYLLLWYMGPVEKISVIDFLGVTSNSEISSSVTFGILTLALLIMLFGLSLKSINRDF